MNGRLYDPILGRMLSPDNYVQSPEFSQSYNRYSYVVNNPLKYIDPSGESWISDFGKGLLKGVVIIVVVVPFALGGMYIGAIITAGNPTGIVIGGIIGATTGVFIAVKINK